MASRRQWAAGTGTANNSPLSRFGDDAVSAPSTWPFGGRPHICVSLAEPDLESLLARFSQLQGADLVEVRLDAVADPSTLGRELFEALVAASPLPLGLTLRPHWQGGKYPGDEGRRRNLLEEASRCGPGFVDVELDAEWAGDFVAAAACPVVASHHWFAAAPSDLGSRVASPYPSARTTSLPAAMMTEPANPSFSRRDR